MNEMHFKHFQTGVNELFCVFVYRNIKYRDRNSFATVCLPKRRWLQISTRSFPHSAMPTIGSLYAVLARGIANEESWF